MSTPLKKKKKEDNYCNMIRHLFVWFGFLSSNVSIMLTRYLSTCEGISSLMKYNKCYVLLSPI